MRFARSSPYGGISVQGSGVSVQGCFYQAEPLDKEPPVRNVEPETETPPEGIWCQAARSSSPAPVNRMTHLSKNITLPQTSFAGGKNTPRLPHFDKDKIPCFLCTFNFYFLLCSFST